MFEYNAKVIEVKDGDTVSLLVDLGFDPIYKTIKRGRLYGIDAPEISTAAGKRAKAFLQKHIAVGDIVRIRTIKTRTTNAKTEKFGGYLVIIVLNPEDPNALTLNEKMIAAGHAKAYYGGAR